MNNDNKIKLDKFIENALLIKSELNFTCLLYGSLGLSTLIKQEIICDDIDILIPEQFLYNNWNSLYNLLYKNGYELIDLHEHTFVKDNIKYSYASIENLKVFANIDLDDIKSNDVYKILDLNQYLKVYQASLKDGYRQNNKNKNDLEKINIIISNLK